MLNWTSLDDCRPNNGRGRLGFCFEEADCDICTFVKSDRDSKACWCTTTFCCCCACWPSSEDNDVVSPFPKLVRGVALKTSPQSWDSRFELQLSLLISLVREDVFSEAFEITTFSLMPQLGFSSCIPVWCNESFFRAAVEHEGRDTFCSFCPFSFSASRRSRSLSVDSSAYSACARSPLKTKHHQTQYSAA